MRKIILLCFVLSNAMLFGQHSLKVYFQGGQPSIWRLGRNGYRQASFKLLENNNAELFLSGQGLERPNVLRKLARGQEKGIKRRFKAYYFAIRQIEKSKPVRNNGRQTLSFYKKGFQVKVNMTWSEDLGGYVLEMTS
jgi:hypothetical protein